MRQALLVENPKWEPYTKAREAFKASKAPCVLIERGRAKEGQIKVNKPGPVKLEPDSAEALAADLRKAGKDEADIDKAVKAWKKPSLKKAVAAVVGLFLLAINIQATEPIDITTRLGATTIQGTNATDSAAFRWEPYDVLVIQTTAAGIADATNVTFTFDTSLDSRYWTNAVTSFEVAQDGTNVVTYISKVTNDVGGLYWRVGQTECPATNTLTISQFLYYIEP